VVRAEKMRKLVETDDAVATRVHELGQAIHMCLWNVLQVKHSGQALAYLAHVASVGLVGIHEPERLAERLEARVQLLLEDFVMHGELIAHCHDLRTLSLAFGQKGRPSEGSALAW